MWQYARVSDSIKKGGFFFHQKKRFPLTFTEQIPVIRNTIKKGYSIMNHL